jgi:hypothetical protein
MQFATLQQLYKKLLPAFNVKIRLIKYSKHKHITNENIWLFLANTKWKNAHNLELPEMVNDIITVDLDEINEYLSREED